MARRRSSQGGGTHGQGSLPSWVGGGASAGSTYGYAGSPFNGPAHGNTNAPGGKGDKPKNPGWGLGGSYGYAGKGERAKAARKYMEQAATIQEQIDAVQTALGSKGFKKALRKRLGNVSRVYKQQDDSLLDSYNKRVGELEKSAKDNEGAAAGQSYANLTNAGRERANALSQAALQGAGESDLLQSQQMSLRNWNANQNEIQQAQIDTARSIGASLTDVTADTATARENMQIQANTDRETLRNEYYDQREGAFSQLGDLYGQQAELYGYAIEAKGNKKVKKLLKRAQRKTGASYDRMALLTGRAAKNPGMSNRIENWEGETIPGMPKPQAVLNSSDISDQPAAPSGASLRAW